MCGWVPRAGTRGSLLSLPVRLFAKHSPLSPGGFLQRLSSESPGQTPSAKEESPGCGRGRAPRHPLFMGPSLCFQLWSPGGRPHLHRGQCPEGPQPLPTPRSAARAPGHPRAFLFSGPAGSLRASALSSSPGEARAPEFAGPEEAASQLQTGRPPAWGQRSPAWGAAQRGQRAGPGLLRGPGPFTAPADSGQLSGGRARPGRLKAQKGRGAGRALRLPVA